MSKYEITAYASCEACLHVIAYGEYDDGTDAAERAIVAQLRKFGEDTIHFKADGEPLEFSWRACETCGNDLGGDRYKVILIRPVA